MALKTCKNGHTFDTGIYGDKCPYCPSGETVTTKFNGGGETVYDNAPFRTMAFDSSAKPTEMPTASTDNEYQVVGGGTVIRPAGGKGSSADSGANRRLAGLLVSYDTNPLGDVFKIFEGRNLIGRGATMDIPLKGDNQISTEHLLILYRSGEGVFWAVDQKSSNGTYVNGEFKNEAQLKNFDVITVGNTRLTFISVPYIESRSGQDK